MKKDNIAKIAIFLVLLVCITGAVNAAETNDTNNLESTVDETVTPDTTPIDDSANTEPNIDTNASTTPKTTTKTAEDTIKEPKKNNGTQTDDIIKETANKETEPTRGTPTTASNWGELSGKCIEEDDQDILLTGTIYTANSQIIFGNNATITGTSNSYITGGTTSTTPFYNSNSNLSISFINVRFVNMNVCNLLELAGTTRFENCTFTNIHTATGHNSIIYNTQGTMDIIGCNLTHNTVGYGAVTNYNNQTLSDATMTVDNCKFIDNSAEVEPGAINNCGNLEVTNSEFINNYATWWAGAIHTHNYANTTINNCNFTNNGAGWNGGALYTYSKLNVYNSIFINNSCATSAGGGAIGASSGWLPGVNYDITIENCTFENNTNNVSTTSQNPTQGNGGAIAAMNSGVLNVHGSTFINNFAARGQAIAAYGAGYISPEGNITEGIPKVMVYNNTFRDHHRINTTDTAYLTGTFTLENNTFINCHQSNTGTPNTNTFINCTPESVNTGNLAPLLLKANLLSSSELLQPTNYDKNIYMNTTRDYNDNQDGLSWETAIGGTNKINNVISKIGDATNVAIHIFGNQTRKNLLLLPIEVNVTFIGYGDSSINNIGANYEMSNNDRTWTYINLTIKNADFSKNCNFINCKFTNGITFTKTLASYDRRALIENGNDVGRNFTFENCTFENYEGTSPLVTLYEFSTLTLNNCTFNNITADSIFYHGLALQQDDCISLYECKFTNCNVKGIVDFAGDIDLGEYCAIENCDYDSEITTGITSLEDHTHNYVNATKLKAVASTIEISSTKKGEILITLTDGTNPIAGATLKYRLNNGEEKTTNTNSDGKATITTDINGIVSINVNYEGNDSYKSSANNNTFNFTQETTPIQPENNTNNTNTPTNPTKPVVQPKKVTKTASKIVASAKTYKATTKNKKYTITLKSGKKVIKKVKVTLTINKKTYTVKTNKKGQAIFKINLKKKGKYTAKIKFAGNKTYKATTKTVKIIIKK